MRPSLLLLTCVVLGCSSGGESGTESGNPTRDVCKDVKCAPCPAPIILHITDAVSGAPLGAAVTVDGEAVGCSDANASRECSLTGASYATPGSRQIAVVAPGYREKTITVDVPSAADSQCCKCPSGSVVVAVWLVPAI